MRVVFFGSRSWRDVLTIDAVIVQLALDEGAIAGVVGHARGADDLAEQCLRRRGFTPIVEPAAWNVHDREGATPVPCRCDGGARHCRGAGYRRNQLMIDRHLLPFVETETVIARGFRTEGDSPGTDDMLRRLKAAGIRGVLKRGLAELATVLPEPKPAKPRQFELWP